MKVLVLSLILILISGVTVADPIIQMTLYDQLLKTVVCFKCNWLIIKEALILFIRYFKRHHSCFQNDGQQDIRNISKFAMKNVTSIITVSVDLKKLTNAEIIYVNFI